MIQKSSHGTTHRNDHRWTNLHLLYVGTERQSPEVLCLSPLNFQWTLSKVTDLLPGLARVSCHSVQLTKEQICLHFLAMNLRSDNYDNWVQGWQKLIFCSLTKCLSKAWILFYFEWGVHNCNVTKTMCTTWKMKVTYGPGSGAINLLGLPSTIKSMKDPRKDAFFGKKNLIFR